MRNQIISIFCILPAILGALFFSSHNANAQSDLLHRVSCNLSGSSVVVRFGMTKRPTNFGVVTPDDTILYLVEPAKGIDHLGRAYNKDTLALKIDALKGTKLRNGVRSDKKVFETAGRYTLLFEDANRAEYEDLHTLRCDIDIPVQPLAKNVAEVGNTCAAVQTTLTGLIADESRVSSEGIRQVGCQVTSGCGQYGCCTRSFPGQPCYCSTCCLAKPSGILTRVAATDRP